VVVPDVIGHSYMFDLNIVMENHSVDDHDIKCGDKIARIVIVKPENAVLEEQR
jgi:dUTPase